MTGENIQTTLSFMQAARRWLVWEPNKQPFYLDGTPRRGQLDTPNDLARLGTYADACNVVAGSGGRFVGVGFALGQDENGGYWQGIDLDDIPDGQLDQWAAALPGYVEVSPSGKGLHAYGYGRGFLTLGPNGSGFEAYARARFFAVTGWRRKDEPLQCLAHTVETKVAPLHQRHTGATGAAIGAGSIPVDPKTVTELRWALNAIPTDDYHVWVRMGCALSELAEGRELWLSWSQQSAKWRPEDAKNGRPSALIEQVIRLCSQKPRATDGSTLQARRHR